MVKLEEGFYINTHYSPAGDIIISYWKLIKFMIICVIAFFGGIGLIVGMFGSALSIRKYLKV